MLEKPRIRNETENIDQTKKNARNKSKRRRE